MSKREKILIAVLLIAVAAFVYFNYFLTPLQKKTQELRVSVAENRTKAEETRLYMAQIEEGQAELAGLKARYEEKLSEIPAVLDQAELLNGIHDIVEGHGDTASLIFLPAEERAYYTAVPVSLEVFCDSYQDMDAILSGLEDSDFTNLTRDMRLDALAEAADTGAAGTGDAGEPADAPARGNKIDMVVTIDFLCMSVNEIEPRDYGFVKDGTYGSDDLFKPVQ